jgi:hypothetical protein
MLLHIENATIRMEKRQDGMPGMPGEKGGEEQAGWNDVGETSTVNKLRIPVHRFH